MPNVIVANNGQQKTGGKTKLKALVVNEELKTEASNSISNFFVKKKHLPKQERAKETPIKFKETIEINADVLDELPEVIRKEIIQEYGLSEDYCERKEVTGVKDDGGEGPSASKKGNEPDKTFCDLNYSQVSYCAFQER